MTMLMEVGPMYSLTTFVTWLTGQFMFMDVGPMDSLTTVVTWLTGQFTSVLATITSNPILLLSVGIFACGAVIGLCKRLIHS